jgi:starch synthase
VWDPASDSALAALYAPDNLAGKAACKAALQRELGLSLKARAPLFGVVSRLSAQKGLDLVLPAIGEIMRRGGQLAVLGSGDGSIERQFLKAAAAHPGAVAFHTGFNEALSHRMIGGSDVIVVPSRFEPCGLTQMYGLRYGTLPLVRRVGGLADTVVDASEANVARDAATGFVFDEATPVGLGAAIDRAVVTYGNGSRWTQIMRRAMAQNFSWDASAQKYVEVYRAAQPSP